MADRMRAFAGPWYVLDHVRPFPGVTYERFVRQIRRGVLTETTVVRGPTTDHQWRFAAEAPGLSKYLGVCWKCHGRVIPREITCPSCGVDLGELTDHSTNGRMTHVGAIPPTDPPEVESPALKELRAVIETMPRPAMQDARPRQERSIKTSWIVATILIGVILAALVVAGSAGRAGRHAQPTDLDTPASLSVGSGECDRLVLRYLLIDGCHWQLGASAAHDHTGGQAASGTPIQCQSFHFRCHDALTSGTA